MRLAVYTCITNGYDELLPPQVTPPGVDYYCFTDDADVVVAPWTYRDVGALRLGAAEQNRYLKMHPHKYFPHYDASVYVDGNIRIVGDLRALAEEALRHADIAMYRHPVRNCLYDEAAACVLIGLDWVPKVRRQMRRYEREGYPRRHGLNEANIIVRRHNQSHIAKAMELWWQEYSAGARRDQLALNYVLWKSGVHLHDLGPSDARTSNVYFEYKQRPPRPNLRMLARKIANRLLLNTVYRRWLARNASE